MSTNHFNHLISEFSKAIGLPELLTNDEGYYCFLLEDDLVIHIDHDSDSSMTKFFIQLGQIRSTNRDAVMADMLDANVLWRGTGGATLGLDSVSGIVTLAYQESVMHMAYSRFEAILVLLISNSKIWMDRISSEPAVQSDSEPDLLPRDAVIP